MAPAYFYRRSSFKINPLCILSERGDRYEQTNSTCFCFLVFRIHRTGLWPPDPSGPDEPATGQEVTYIDAGQSIANDSSVPDAGQTITPPPPAIDAGSTTPGPTVPDSGTPVTPPVTDAGVTSTLGGTDGGQLQCSSSSQCAHDVPYCDPQSNTCVPCTISCAANSHCEVNANESQTCVCNDNHVLDAQDNCVPKCASNQDCDLEQDPSAMPFQAYVARAPQESA